MTIRNHRNWPRTERDIVRILMMQAAWMRGVDFPLEFVAQRLACWDCLAEYVDAVIASAEQARRKWAAEEPARRAYGCCERESGRAACPWAASLAYARASLNAV